MLIYPLRNAQVNSYGIEDSKMARASQCRVGARVPLNLLRSPKFTYDACHLNHQERKP